MTSPTGNPMEAVTSLLQERQRFEGWLSTLESRRTTTPAHVYERVRSDYDGRLRNVLDQLAGRTSELQAMADALATRVAQLQTEENTHRDNRHEAELRTAVGEYTQQRWDEISRNADEQIARLTAERTTVSAELGRLQQILAMVGARRPGSAEAPAVAPLPQPSPPAPAATRTAPEAPRAQTVTTPSNSFDELAFLKSVVGTRADGSPATRPAGGASTPPSPQTPPRAAASQRAPQPAAAAAASGQNSGGVGTKQAAPGGRPSPDAGGVPAFLRDVPAEQSKTLKCQECGTMNYPTEWYCERCGGELAAM